MTVRLLVFKILINGKNHFQFLEILSDQSKTIQKPQVSNVVLDTSKKNLVFEKL